MVSCPSCLSIVIVDIDGHVQMGGQESFVDPGLAETVMAEGQSDRTEMMTAEGGSELPETVFHRPANTFVEQSLDALNQEIPYQSAEEENSFANYQVEHDQEPEAEQELPEADEAESYEVMSPELAPDEQSWLEDSVEKTSVSQDLSEIADYGNSEMSLAKDGLYLYDVRISDIDSAKEKNI